MHCNKIHLDLYLTLLQLAMINKAKDNEDPSKRKRINSNLEEFSIK